MVPILTSGIGGGIGYYVGKSAEYYNEEIIGIENSFKEILTHYRVKEEQIEETIDSIPGLSLWQKGYQKLFGGAQEVTGVKELFTSTETHAKLSSEEISLQGLKLPDSYGTYPLVGLTIGFVYGLMKVGNKLSSLKREEKLLKLVGK